MNTAETDQELGNGVYGQALDLWIVPEIERRANLGLVSKPFPLTAAQVIFPSPRMKGDIQVRLNEEVQAKVLYKADRPIEKGELVRIDTPDSIREIQLLDGDSPDSGHLTMFLVGDRWVVHFDFRRDKDYSRLLLQRAREFYATALQAIHSGRMGPAFENLFAAAELAAKAELLVHAYFPNRKRNKHQALNGRYSTWARLGNAPRSGSGALEELQGARAAARYCERSLPVGPSGELTDAVNQMITHAEQVTLRTIHSQE